MKLFELWAEIGLDTSKFDKGVKDATQAGKDMASNASSISAKAVAMGAAIYDVAKGAASAAVNLVKTITEEYAQTEQLIGGVQTLFKDSAQDVIKNAEVAYKTAGMSANEYMQTVTGFASTLLQSLKGDTVEAARYADMAVKDMSDNANKFGSDMASIENAYQGFAKQNFSMLDNLKLGYGGTKKEMQRLLKDAQKIQRANGNKVKYNINNLDDIIEAIHVIQESMGVTGTTAAEAADTLGGSMNAFSATWKNLLSGLGNSSADMDALISSVFDAGIDVIRNFTKLLPSIGQNVKKAFMMLVNKAKESLPLLKAAFVDFWDKKLPQLVTFGVNNIIKKINKLFGTNIPAIKSISLPKWKDIEGAITAWWDGIRAALSGVTKWSIGVFENPTASAEETKQAIADWWTNTARPAIEGFCTWYLGAPGAPTTPREEVEATMKEWWGKAGQWISNACSWTLQMAGVPDEDATTISEMISTWWDSINDSLMSICNVTISLIGGDTDSAVEVIKGWWDSFKEKVLKYTQLKFDLTAPLAEKSAEGIKIWWNNVKASVGDAINYVFSLLPPEITDAAKTLSDWWSSIVDSISQAMSATMTIKAPDASKILEDIKAWWQQGKADLAKVMDTPITVSAPNVAEMAKTISEWWNGIKASISKALATDFSVGTPDISAFADSIKKWWENTKQSVSEWLTVSIDIVPPQVKETIDKIKAWWSGILENLKLTIFPSFGTPSGNPSGAGYATGLNYVPYDNFQARLHKGEAILTAQEATEWRTGQNVASIQFDTANIESLLSQLVAAASNPKPVPAVIDGSSVYEYIARRQARDIRSKYV